MSQAAPIGVFDSGYGGLTVLKELVKRLPQYDYLYLGDNARAPYGTRSFDTVYHYTLDAVKWFFEQGCHLVILACNTASAKALRTIQQNDLPTIAPEKRVLGVIRPTTEIIGRYSKPGKWVFWPPKAQLPQTPILLKLRNFIQTFRPTRRLALCGYLLLRIMKWRMPVPIILSKKPT
ncbi:glutamate racemase [Niabella hibiscisoli]|uniref:glutamate racemase n=1 Tax=Niabella hibiscisoli TaxID=1825928 RepID=UPI001F0D0A92|nr:hypothetical protein [Niabella hibiscisoli]MCH5715448.1 hypothetical protein [Niabella hibiscisoli]